MNHVTGKLLKSIKGEVKKKNKENYQIKPSFIKNHIWIFVNALIENQSFDSQTKDTLTTIVSKFGSICNLKDSFLKKIIQKTGIVQASLRFSQYKASNQLKKVGGMKIIFF